MPKTLIHVDEVLLAEARRLLGTTVSRKETINQALGELIRHRRRKAAVQAEIDRFEAGRYGSLRAEGGRR